MNYYEALLLKARKKGLVVLEMDLGTNKKCGKLLDNNIILNKNMTQSDKYEILAEEIGHYDTSYGHICDQSKIENRKQELTARRYGYKYIATPHSFVEAIKNGARDLESLAEHFLISIELLVDIITDWKKQYGLGVHIGEYYPQLHPSINLHENYPQNFING